MRAPPLAHREAIVAQFNETAPVGTRVRFYPGARGGAARFGVIRHPATLLGGHTPVAWIDGHVGCVAITNVDVLQTAETPA